jgi:broad specificity phosphatase PhoE
MLKNYDKGSNIVNKQPNFVSTEANMRLFITRHGESRGNIRTQEGPDPELSEHGLLQARLLGERLSELKFDCIISSPLIRALATANEVAVRQPEGPATVELLPDLMERNTPPGYAGLPFDELKKICPSIIPYDVPTPTGGGAALKEEDNLRVLARAYEVISYVRRRFSRDENVLLVAHGSFNSFLIAAALNQPHPENFWSCQETTGLSLIRYTNEDGRIFTRLEFLNDAYHLYRHGVNTSI